MTFWDSLDPRYRLILCDVWGVVHDGVSLYPGAAERLRQWRGDGRQVVLVTNAPRTADSVAAQLERIGLPRDCWDAIATSGEAGIKALAALDAPVGFIGTDGDRAELEARGVRIAEGYAFADLACVGPTAERPTAGEYRGDLELWAGRGVRLHCLNPDRIVVSGGIAEDCAGAIADLYEEIGGPVIWYGKPYRPIYDFALKLGRDPPAGAVLAVGDSLRTDVVGAARMGFDAVFVAGGIHAGEAFPDNFAQDNGLGAWRPVAVVDGLA